MGFKSYCVNKRYNNGDAGLILDYYCFNFTKKKNVFRVIFAKQLPFSFYIYIR